MITIQPLGFESINTGYKWLNVFSASHAFEIASPAHGLSNFSVRSGRSYDVAQYNQVNLYNPSSTDVLTIDLEVSPLQATSQSVDIANEPWIAGIREAIQVTAAATVENGKMSMLPANSVNPISDTVIPANGITLFAPARVAVNRQVTIQIITDDVDMSKVRVGADSGLLANEGIFLTGNIDSPAGYEWETETAVYIRNMTDKPVTVTGGEQWRS